MFIHRTKRKRSPRRWVWRMARIVVASMGVYGLYMIVTGLSDGELPLYGRYTKGAMVGWAEEPIGFCLALVLLAGGSALMLWLAIADWGES